MSTHLPPVSIGIITLDTRTTAFAKLLDYLIPALDQYEALTELVVINNSGAGSEDVIQKVLDDSKIAEKLPVSLINSPQNNIATARNILLENTNHDLLAFIDDDEFPEKQWLAELVQMYERTGCVVVAGPVHAVFEAETPRWVTQIDLHNTRDRTDGGIINMTGTGNVLIHKPSVANFRFKESFGKSGGSDTDFFLRVYDAGHQMRWATRAVAYEDIPPSRANPQYLFGRFMSQGANYRRVMTERGLVKNSWLFGFRAFGMFIASLPIALVLLLIRHPRTGDWFKRAFSNLGKVISKRSKLYE